MGPTATRGACSVGRRGGGSHLYEPPATPFERSGANDSKLAMFSNSLVPERYDEG